MNKATVAQRDAVVVWLGATLGGAECDWPRTRLAAHDLAAMAVDAGIVTLLDRAMADAPSARGITRDERTAVHAGAQAAAAQSMLRERECRLVLEVIGQAGIRLLLLKGSALAYWLYPQPVLRECCDIDLLFASRSEADKAMRLLASRGYAQKYSQGSQAYETLFRRQLSPTMHVDLDIHWALVNAPMFADAFAFDDLYADSVAIPALGPFARGLSPVHAFAHACIHRGLNLYTGIGDGLKWRYDLHLLAQQFTPVDWDALLVLCRERDLCGVCAEGIDAAVAAFGTKVPDGVVQGLHDGRSQEALDASRLGDWTYMQRQNFSALGPLGTRLRWMWQRLFPPLGYMQALYGTDKGRVALLAERFLRGLRRIR